MDPKGKIIIYVSLFIVIGLLVYLTFSASPNDHLDRALRSLDTAQRRLDTALVKIGDSRKVLDSMRVNFSVFQSQVTTVSNEVKQLNTNTNANAQRFDNSIKQLRLRNQEVVQQLKIRRDTLPEIKIYKYEN